MHPFTVARLQATCKKLFQISLLFSSLSFAFLRMIFFELPFSWIEDGVWIIKLIAAGFFMTLSSFITFHLLIIIFAELKKFILDPGYGMPGFGANEKQHNAPIGSIDHQRTFAVRS